MRILQSGEVDEWIDVLRRSDRYDFYHLPSYHSLAEERGQGTAHLFVYEYQQYTIALPLLLRPLRDVPPLQSLGRNLSDATSVYGYAGPISSHSDVPDAVAQSFRTQLSEALQRHGTVAVFSRLHPLIDHSNLLTGLGELKILGKTVSIDLTQPGDIQWKQIRKVYRQNIAKLELRSVKCIEDREMAYLPSFMEIYEETMRRVGADETYLFGSDYFDGFARATRGQNHLFIALLDDHIIAGALFVGCGSILQYHLAGTRDSARTLSPMTLVLDTARRWGTEQGFKMLHLGGGVGCQDDSLFHFKAGFSDRRHAFNCWRWIVRPKVYAELCAEAERFRQLNEYPDAMPGFFPEYRSPLVSRASMTLV